MLKKENRIQQKKDFERIKRNGTRIDTPLFGLLWLKENNEEKKMGMVVSKRISKKAVERNKIRRLLAEATRKHLRDIPVGFCGVILAKGRLLGLKYRIVENELIACLKQIP